MSQTGGMTFQQFRELLNKIDKEHKNKKKHIQHVASLIDMIDYKISIVRLYTPLLKDGKDYIEFNCTNNEHYDLYMEIINWLDKK
jgi:hypothetical protein